MWINTQKIKETALDLLFPKFCLSCGAEGAFLCASCKEAIAIRGASCLVCGKRDILGKTCLSCRRKTAVRRFFTPFSYKNTVMRDLLHAYKYHRVRELAGPLAGFLAEAMLRADFRAKEKMAFIPIPLHPRRMARRGFNQAELLALELSEKFGVPVLTEVLIRVRHTATQIELADDYERRANVAGAFRVVNPAAIAKKIVILVDDVITSGATLNEAAGVMKKAGAKSIWAAAVARR